MKPAVLPVERADSTSREVAGGLQAYAGSVAAAQQVSTQIGCGRVEPAGPRRFTAICESYDVLIACQGGQCRPLHTLPVSRLDGD